VLICGNPHGLPGFPIGTGVAEGTCQDRQTVGDERGLDQGQMSTLSRTISSRTPTIQQKAVHDPLTPPMSRRELFVQQDPHSMALETTKSICRQNRETVRVAANQHPGRVS
jgi:hypothetical protein